MSSKVSCVIGNTQRWAGATSTWRKMSGHGANAKWIIKMTRPATIIIAVADSHRARPTCEPRQAACSTASRSARWIMAASPWRRSSSRCRRERASARRRPRYRPVPPEEPGHGRLAHFEGVQCAQYIRPQGQASARFGEVWCALEDLNLQTVPDLPSLLPAGGQAPGTVRILRLSRPALMPRRGDIAQTYRGPAGLTSHGGCGRERGTGGHPVPRWCS